MILDIKRFIALGKYVGNFSYEYQIGIAHN